MKRVNIESAWLMQLVEQRVYDSRKLLSSLPLYA